MVELLLLRVSWDGRLNRQEVGFLDGSRARSDILLPVFPQNEIPASFFFSSQLFRSSLASDLGIYSPPGIAFGVLSVLRTQGGSNANL